MGKRRKWMILGMLAFASYLGVGFYHYWINRSFEPDSIRVDFERAWEDDWEKEGGRLELCCPHSAQVVADPVDPKNHALRFEIKVNDPDTKGKKRGELRRRAPRPGDEFWYQFRLLIPEDWKPSSAPTTVIQWHGVPEILLAEYGRAPPVRLAVVDGQWKIVAIWDGNRITNKWLSFLGDASLAGGEILWSGQVQHKVWTTWTFHIIWSPTSEGRLEIWKDGQRIVHREGPNAYNDVLAPYFKIGPYLPNWKVSGVDNRVLYADDIAISSSPLLGRRGNLL